ncbi:hypothetical protein [Cellulomonas soli]
MGSIESFVYGGGAWGGSVEDLPSLSVTLRDGEIATIDYRPAPEGLGRFYLGFQPRDYLDDPAESEPVDLDAESEAFAEWALLVGAVDVEAKHVRRLLAVEQVDEPVDTFVEETVERLLRLVGLPVPDGLEGDTML